MQDKEFDNLFRSKLDGFETEPSANVWEGIDAELRTGNRRRIMVPLLSAAASIIVLVTAGVLLIPHHIKNTEGHSVKTTVAKRDTTVQSPIVVPSNKIAQVNTTVKQGPVKRMVASQSVKKQPVTVQPQTGNTVALQKPAVKQPTQEVLAALPQKHDVIIQPKQIDTAVLAANTTGTPDIKPTQAMVPDKQIIAKTLPPVKKHHIHSLGDMLNTVIAAVDKRKDKLIEFTDTDDDDDSMITGVNLGVVAVKKQN